MAVEEGNKGNVISLSVSASLSGKRLDQALTELLKNECSAGQPELRSHAVTRSQVATWIEEGRVELNGRRATRLAREVRTGDTLVLSLPREERGRILPDPSVPFRVVYEDADLIVVDKPPGLVVHPGAGHRGKTLVHGLVGRFRECNVGGDESRPGLVHRLDKDTSGLLVVAKSHRAFHSLVRQFNPPREIRRDYLALVLRLPSGRGVSYSGDGAGEISLHIGRHRRDRVRMTATEHGGREARTRFRVEEELRTGFLLRLSLETGRTHQIRVHLRAVGAPIIGDPLYGSPLRTLPSALRPAVSAFGRQSLHATALSFLHPLTGERLQFSVPPPDDMLELIELFRRGCAVSGDLNRRSR